MRLAGYALAAAAAFVATGPAAAQDAAAGAVAFKVRCSTCRSVTRGAPTGVGPNLAGSSAAAPPARPSTTRQP